MMEVSLAIPTLIAVSDDRSMTSSSFGSSVSAKCLLLTFFLSAQFLSCRAAPDGECFDSELVSLFRFKRGLADPENRLSSWQGRECCGWRGVDCDNQTGLVTEIDIHAWNLGGMIDPSLLQLKSLSYLDLSGNSFDSIQIPPFIGSLSGLKYLNLSKAGFAGTVPAQLGNLSKLQHLDISSSFSSLVVDDFKWVSGLSSLKYLAMDGVDLSMVGADWIHTLNRATTLRELHLSACSLSGIAQSLPLLNLTSLAIMNLAFNSFDSRIPNWLVNLSSLIHTDISDSGLQGSIPTKLSELPNLSYLDLSMNDNLTADCSKLLGGSWSKLRYLKLGLNRVHGSLPDSIGNISFMAELDLFFNDIGGGIPSSIGKLCNLVTLNLAGNNLSLGLPKSLVRGNSCIKEGIVLPNLLSLSLSNNQLVGVLPEWLGELRNLVTLHLGYNLFSGPIPPSLGNLLFLEDMSLGGNELNGTIPPVLGQLSKLVILDISSNQLTGTVSELHFSNLSNLKILSMSSNSLVINVTSAWAPPFRVRNLGMGSCQLGPQFPLWLEHQRELMYLDFSNASISGTLPAWFWDLSSNLSLLNISFNHIDGHLPNQMNVAAFADIDMSSNLLSGPIPVLSNEVELLDLSHNQLTGPIPPNIGDLQPNLIYLSLSNNNLTGIVPASIGDIQGLQVIDVSRNNLIGSIPPTLQNCSYLKALVLEHNSLSGAVPSLRGLKQLQTLHLSDNFLSGVITSSLKNCSSLETLDLGDNRLYGEIPTWFGEIFPELRILRIRSNRFSGQIPSLLSNLTSLQVLDLAENEFVGTIPHSFGDFKAMTADQKMIRYLQYGQYRGNYYEESVSINVNNRQLVYTKTLSLLTSIDLSRNKLTGGFPESLTSLRGLLILDLSHNGLIGRIPDRIGLMHEMLSLDLSNNLFSGGIPSDAASMSFLSYLNLSANNFSGKIPSTGQFVTFPASAYSGNPYLCGAPLANCEETQPDGVPDSSKDTGYYDDHLFEDKWFNMSVGMGFAAGLLGLFAVISIRKPWCVAYFKFVDWAIDGIVQVKHVSNQATNCRTSTSRRL